MARLEAEVQTKNLENVGRMLKVELALRDYPTGLASMYRSVYETCDPMSRGSYKRNCANYTFDGGTPVNPKCVSSYNRQD